ncbi:MAG: hypothetical protein H6563_09725 [Lewinellaceae bacterium]|nr:hypothetical protein [Lewinellaceae bacterium]
MKKTLFLLSFSLFAFHLFSQTTLLTVNYKFAHIEEGYDHNSKTQVLIDDDVVGESQVAPQSQSSTFTVSVPKGSHNLKVVNWALYEGVWEEHTIENNYSIDAFYETDHNFKKAEKLYLVFDLDNGMMASWKKPVKVKK